METKTEVHHTLKGRMGEDEKGFGREILLYVCQTLMCLDKRQKRKVHVARAYA
jgi:hypothetical protein